MTASDQQVRYIAGELKVVKVTDDGYKCIVTKPCKYEMAKFIKQDGEYHLIGRHFDRKANPNSMYKGGYLGGTSVFHRDCIVTNKLKEGWGVVLKTGLTFDVGDVIPMWTEVLQEPYSSFFEDKSMFFGLGGGGVDGS